MLGEEGGGGGVLTLQWLTSHPGESSNTLSCFMLLRNQDKLHLGEPIVQTLSLTLQYLLIVEMKIQCQYKCHHVYNVLQETALVFIRESDFTRLTQLLSPVEFSRLKPLVLLLGWPYCYSCENAKNLLEALWDPAVKFTCFCFNFFLLFQLPFSHN